MKRQFQTVQVTADSVKEANANLHRLACELHAQKYEVISHCIYKDDHDPYTLIVSVLAKKDSFL